MIIKKGFVAKGTTCESCASIIRKQAKKVKGVKKVTFDYSNEVGYVTFDNKITDIDKILTKIEEKNYSCFILDESSEKSKKNIIGWLLAIVGIIIVAYFLLGFIESINMPAISQNMGYGLLFLVGLLTGFHCISMCGGFVVSYSTKHAKEGKDPHSAHLMYATGKLISYTLIGAIFGLLGSFIAFTPKIRSIIGIFAGLFLVLFGLKMLNIFPTLRKISLTPKFVNKFITKNSKNATPLTIGLLNGLMIACGPLQAIYVMAAGTGSMVEGAKLLFIFAAGTLPVMIGFGYFASYVSGKMTQKILKASGFIVILLGLIMINNGLVLSGSGYDFKSLVSLPKLGENSLNNDIQKKNSIILNNGYQEIKMEVTRYGWNPDKFVLKKGVPVKWIIDVKELTGCNNEIQVPDYNIKFKLKKGIQTIEFTPEESDTVRWSCWMGMIPGTFVVLDDISDQDEVSTKLANVKEPITGSCGGSCGSPNCAEKTGGGCGCGGK